MDASEKEILEFTARFVLGNPYVNGIEDSTLKEIQERGHDFHLRQDETLDDVCLSVSLVRIPQKGEKLKTEVGGRRIFYHICNEKIKYGIYMPQ